VDRNAREPATSPVDDPSPDSSRAHRLEIVGEDERHGHHDHGGQTPPSAFSIYGAGALPGVRRDHERGHARLDGPAEAIVQRGDPPRAIGMMSPHPRGEGAAPSTVRCDELGPRFRPAAKELGRGEADTHLLPHAEGAAQERFMTDVESIEGAA
jgi:hypothetical protein